MALSLKQCNLNPMLVSQNVFEMLHHTKQVPCTHCHLLGVLLALRGENCYQMKLTPYYTRVEMGKNSRESKLFYVLDYPLCSF